MQTACSAFLVLLLCGVAPAWAHADSPASPPLVPAPMTLKYQKPGEIIALFAREDLPAIGRAPHTACTDTEESLLPGGTNALLPGPQENTVMLVGTEGVSYVRDSISVIDVPVEATGPGRERVVLTLQHANGAQVRAVALHLPEAGMAVVQGRRLTLVGSPAWLHRALRQVIRAELHEPADFAIPKR